MLSTCEGFTCMYDSVHILELSGSQFYTDHLQASKLDQYLCLDAISHNPELTGLMACMVALCLYTFIIVTCLKKLTTHKFS